MPGRSIELHMVNHITVGTVGKPGQRTFLLQAADAIDTITLKLEKEQTRALAHATNELLDNLEEQDLEAPPPSLSIPLTADLLLREPAEPLFAVGQIGLGYDRTRDMIVLAVQELMLDETEEPSTARFWISRYQAKMLSKHAIEVVEQGRPTCPLCGRPMELGKICCPRVNGHYKALLQ